MDMSEPHLADSAFWQAPLEERLAAFAALRRDAPVQWFGPRRSAFARETTGFWALTGYEDVWHASRHPTVFCSGRGIDVEATPPELAAYTSSMITMDDPEHFRLRRLVSSGFTPKHTAALVDRLRVTATEIVDDVIEAFGDGAEFDFVEHIASKLPLHAICMMMGVPTQDQRQLFDWTNAIVSPDDGADGIDRAAVANAAMAEYAAELGLDRLARPTEDLTSVLMHAEVDGERLSSQEFANFFILLLSAGNETTRNGITHGMRLLTQHPDQRRIWFDDFDRHAATAVEEIVRFETPITHMCRIVTQDVEIGGVRIGAGEKVALWYTSANRDETVFDRADEFDVTRPLHPQQVAYGAGGPHFCLGANLARREMIVMFDEIRRRLPDLQITAEPERVLSMSLNAVRRVTATVR